MDSTTLGINEILQFSQRSDFNNPPEGWSLIDSFSTDSGDSTLYAYRDSQSGTTIITGHGTAQVAQGEGFFDYVEMPISARLDMAETIEGGRITWSRILDKPDFRPEPEQVRDALRDISESILKDNPDTTIVTTASGQFGMVMGWASVQLDDEQGPFSTAHTNTITYESPGYWGGSEPDPKGLNIVIKESAAQVWYDTNLNSIMPGDERLDKSVAEVAIDPGYSGASLQALGEAGGWVVGEVLDYFLPKATAGKAEKWVSNEALQEFAEYTTKQGNKTISGEASGVVVHQAEDFSPAIADVIQALDKAGLGDLTPAELQAKHAQDPTPLDQALEVQLGVDEWNSLIKEGINALPGFIPTPDFVDGVLDIQPVPAQGDNDVTTPAIGVESGQVLPDNNSSISSVENQLIGQLADDELAAEKVAEEIAENDALTTPPAPAPEGGE